jgi:hypothetical protein
VNMLPDFAKCTQCFLTYREATNDVACGGTLNGKHVWENTLDKKKFTSYAELGRSIGELVDRKQQEYGDSFGRLPEQLRLFFPAGIAEDQYPALLVIVRMLDKINRVSCGNQGEESAFEDLAGYALLAVGKGL